MTPTGSPSSPSSSTSRPSHDGDLVSLKYNQIESPMHEPIVQECRGMVVHVPTGTILAHPYNKFWNHGEALAAPIDWARRACSTSSTAR
jgi:hypothetical protein